MNQMPDDVKDKNLRACMKCQLIMSYKQWKTKICVNCGMAKDDNELTAYFSGMVSLMLPTASWVARYRNLSNRKPGIYALKLLDDDIDAEDDYVNER